MNDTDFLLLAPPVSGWNISHHKGTFYPKKTKESGQVWWFLNRKNNTMCTNLFKSISNTVPVLLPSITTRWKQMSYVSFHWIFPMVPQVRGRAPHYGNGPPRSWQMLRIWPLPVLTCPWVPGSSWRRVCGCVPKSCYRTRAMASRSPRLFWAPATRRWDSRLVPVCESLTLLIHRENVTCIDFSKPLWRICATSSKPQWDQIVTAVHEFNQGQELEMFTRHKRWGRVKSWTCRKESKSSHESSHEYLSYSPFRVTSQVKPLVNRSGTRL